MAAADTAPLSPLDALIWRLDADPSLRAAFATVSFLDRAPDRERLHRRLAWAVADLPHFSHRVVGSRVPGVPPSWEDDPDFAVDHHVEWVDLGRGAEPDAGGVDQHVLDPTVLEMAARIAAEPFPAERPLWGFVVVTGLPGGRAAMLHRLHHALTDDEGGIRLSERYLDVEPGASHPSDDHVPDPFPGGPPAEVVTPLERATLAAVERAGGAARGAASVARWTIDGLRDPSRFVAAGTAAVDTARSLGRQVSVTGRQLSPLWTDRSPERRMLADTVPFDALRRIATATSTSINDVFVTAVVRAAGAVHREAGHDVDELRVAVPVSTRNKSAEGERSRGGNAVAPTSVVVPTGIGLTAGAHLRLVSARLVEVRTQPSNRALAPLSAAAELVPTPVLATVVRRQTAAIDLVTSNVRAAAFPLYVAGARILSTHAVGPLMGSPVNVTMMTYDGRADLGIHADTGAVADPEGLRDRIVDAVGELRRSV